MSNFNFNLDNYETVKERKQRFYKDHPDGRITCHIANDDLEIKAVVKAYVFLTNEDQARELPKGVGHALELRDTTRPLNKWGKEYDSVNFTSWLENAEESAVGRALDNAGYASNGKCSRDEMEKAQRNSTAIVSSKNTIVSPQDTDLGSYIVPIGQKYKGKTLEQVGANELRNFVDWLERNAKEKNEKLKGKTAEFVEKASQFIGQFENKPTEYDVPMFDQQRDQYLVK